MEEKKEIKVRLSTAISMVIIFALIVALAVTYYFGFVADEKENVGDEKITNTTENVVSNVATENVNKEENKVEENKTNNSVKNEVEEKDDKEENTFDTNENSFMVILVENNNANDIAYKYKMITDKKEKSNLIDIINSATKYETKSFIPGFGDTPPTVQVYEDNGEKYTIFAGDKIDDDGNIVNLMVKYKKHDGSDKELYKVDIKLAEYIENLYNTSKSSTVTANKEIYTRVAISNMEDSAWEDYNENFIVVEKNKMYFSTDLSDKILEGTYKLKSNNDIEYKMLQPTQDYAFYGASAYRVETINGEKTIVIDNAPNGTMYYQKVH